MQTEELQNEITEINERAAQLKQQLEDSKEKFSQTMVTLFASEETTGYLEKIQKHVNFTIDFRKDQVDMFVSAIIEELKNPATKTSSNHVGLRDSLPTMGSSLIFAI
jgi:vacuolar-type H+-ATPase subunit D/Vma8